MIPESEKAKVNILIVDDDEVLRQVLSDLLELKTGCCVTVLGSGKQALIEVKKKEYKVALLDIGLPDIGGTVLLEQIQTMSPATRCIVLTGRDSKDIADATVAKRAFAYIVKPSNAEHIIKTIEDALHSF